MPLCSCDRAAQVISPQGMRVAVPGASGEGSTKKHMSIEWKEVTMGELLEADGLSAVLKHCAENEVNPIMKLASDAGNKGDKPCATTLWHGMFAKGILKALAFTLGCRRRRCRIRYLVGGPCRVPPLRGRFGLRLQVEWSRFRAHGQV